MTPTSFRKKRTKEEIAADKKRKGEFGPGSKNKTNLRYNRGITPKRVTSRVGLNLNLHPLTNSS